MELKRTARRVSKAAGAWVRDNGSRRVFASKAAARTWADDCDGRRTVWIQDAPPHDTTAADGYLVARRQPPVEYGESPGEQAALDRL